MPGNEKPKCPLCGAEIDTIYTTEQNHLKWDQDHWVKMVRDEEESKVCPSCLEELDPQDLDKLGVPNELR